MSRSNRGWFLGAAHSDDHRKSVPNKVRHRRCLTIMRPLTVAVLSVFLPTLWAQTPTPTATIVGADPTNGIKLTTTIADATINLPIEPTGTLVKFHASVDDFVGPDGKIVPALAKINGHPASNEITLDETDRPILKITAIFPVAGDYKSHVVLFFNEIRQPSVLLTVTRQLNAVTVQIDAVDSAATTKIRKADATLRFSVRENANHEVDVYAPVFVNFGRNVSDKTQKQASYCGFEVTSDGRRSPSFTLGPQQTREFILVIHGIGDAGEYSGTIRVGNADTTPTEKPVTIFVKESGIIAFVFIFFGVLASYLIRYWTKEERPKLEALRRLSNCVDDLAQVELDAGTLSETEEKVFDRMQASLAKLHREIDQRTARDLSATLDETDRKIVLLPKWLTVLRRIRNVDPPSIVTSIQTDCEALADSYFLQAGAKDDDFNTKITAIEKDLDQTLKQDMLNRIEKFRDVINQYRNAHPKADAELNAKVTPLIAVAQKAAEDGKLPEASLHLNEARLAYTVVLAAELKRALSGVPPVGFTNDEWAALGNQLRAKATEITSETDPSKAAALYDAANKAYISALIGALNGEIGRRKNDINDKTNTTISDTDRKRLREDLDAAEKTNEAATTALNSGDWDGARTQYVLAAKSVLEVVQEIDKSRPVGRDILTVFRFSPIPPGIRLTPTEPVPTIPKRLRSLGDTIADVIHRFDLLLNIGLLFIAAILGLKLLWADNPVWGGITDYAIAFLWGLGLQQVGGAGFEGLPALTKKLTDS